VRAAFAPIPAQHCRSRTPLTEEDLAFADSLNLDGLKITAGLRIYPGTPLEASAVQEDLIRAGEALLQPRFYLPRELRGWLPERLAVYEALQASLNQPLSTLSIAGKQAL